MTRPEGAFMDVWLVLEPANGETVAVFDDAKLARDYARMLGRGKPNWLPGYAVERRPVFDRLPREGESTWPA